MRPLILSTAALAISVIAPAQQLLSDLNPRRQASLGSVSNARATVANGLAFLAMNVGPHGAEPWVTDGSAQGTRLLADLSADPRGSVPFGFAPFRGGVVFQTNVGGELFWSDGATTQRLAALEPSSGPPVPVGGLVFFGARIPGGGIEPWVSDGSVAGTRPVVDLNPGTTGSEPGGFVDCGGVAYFRARIGWRWRLCRSDGTPAGTHEVAPLASYDGVGEIAVVGTTVFFATASSPQLPDELWKTDGTAAGTVLVLGRYVSQPASLTAFGSSLLFTAQDGATGREPWISDGTPAGTQLVADIAPGTDSSALSTRFTPLPGGSVLFDADDGVHGRELWRTDGTANGTSLVLDIRPGSGGSFPLYALLVPGTGGRVFFTADDGLHGEELWSSDGSAQGTHLVRDIAPNGSSRATPMAELGGRLLFAADDGRHGFEPWTTDGTASGTRAIGDFAGLPLGSDPQRFASFGRRTLFSADDGTHGREPWISGPGAAAPRLLADLEPGSGSSWPNFLAEWQGRAWFAAHTSGFGTELWSTDGSTNGTAMLADLSPGTGSSLPNSFLPLDGVALFVANVPGVGAELWVTDGTSAGTATIDLDPTSAASPRDLVRLGDYAYFVAQHSAYGTELWRSDGTAAGTTLVVDLVPGPDSATIQGLTASEAALYFAGSNVPPAPFPIDIEPWTSDGTAAGTVRLADLVPGSASSAPAGFVPFGGRTWFMAMHGGGFPTTGLFVTDGSAAGTSMLVDGVEGPPVPAGDRLFFRKAGEIWSSDGTAAGTALTRDIWPGSTSCEPLDLTAAGSGRLVVFSARDSVHGRELYVSDGSAAGTVMLRDLWPGVTPSGPEHVASIGASILLSADDGTTGKEPYVVPLASIGGALAERFARGCPGSAGTPSIAAVGIPRLGEPAFTFTLKDAQPQAAAYLFVSLALQPGADLGRCVPAIAPPAAVAALPTDAAGRASLSLAIPASPGLLGAELFSQWLVLDPGGQFFAAASLSELLDVVVGR